MSDTEEEAKEKWCPFARQVVGDAQAAASGNRDLNCGGPLAVHDGNRCIGSRCMAWRWSEGLYPKDSFMGGEPSRGYCGLAGGQS